jgi:hypothetical protein
MPTACMQHAAAHRTDGTPGMTNTRAAARFIVSWHPHYTDLRTRASGGCSGRAEGRSRIGPDRLPTAVLCPIQDHCVVMPNWHVPLQHDCRSRVGPDHFPTAVLCPVQDHCVVSPRALIPTAMLCPVQDHCVVRPCVLACASTAACDVVARPCALIPTAVLCPVQDHCVARLCALMPKAVLCYVQFRTTALPGRVH